MQMTQISARTVQNHEHKQNAYLTVGKVNTTYGCQQNHHNFIKLVKYPESSTENVLCICCMLLCMYRYKIKALIVI